MKKNYLLLALTFLPGLASAQMLLEHDYDGINTFHGFPTTNAGSTNLPNSEPYVPKVFNICFHILTDDSGNTFGGDVIGETQIMTFVRNLNVA